ncbi:Non-specific serine/threonine protein kinase [Bertholletia excelsa]
MLERREINSIVGPRLQGDFDTNSVWKALETAIASVPPTAIRRPTMSHVLAEFKECQEVYIHEAYGRTHDVTQNNTATSWTTSSIAIDGLDQLNLDSVVSCPGAR